MNTFSLFGALPEKAYNEGDRSCASGGAASYGVANLDLRFVSVDFGRFCGEALRVHELGKDDADGEPTTG